MCDYCDCRRVPEIADLGAEHERIEELGDEALRLAKAGSPEFPAALDRLRAALEPHVTREEKGVFAQARIAGLGSYYVDDLEEDHRRFATILDVGADIDAITLERLLDDLHRHIAVEEYDLFPAAVQVLTDSQWEAIESGRSGAAVG
ncbi:MAG TPA: hemerythrin domain-containing protein [Acidimicrobiia bacterium]|jgi:iron-sulfur cluster repair protein YtfE (RIC family)